MNLLSNALRYSASDTPVVISFARRDSEAEITVSDQGNGVSPQEMSLLFQPYQRARLAEGSQDRLGLGLYVTKGLVEANGGRIWAESEVGKGSTFHFTVPVVSEWDRDRSE